VGEAIAVDGEEPSRLDRQVAFLLEADRLKLVERRTRVTGDERRENSAEHSWHLALFALVLAEWSNEPVDLSRVLALCLVHDLVEIDAGDTFAYDEAGNRTKVEREQAAAERIFGLLPADQARWLRALWDEYEAGETPESRFANAVDRMQPVLLNHVAGAAGPWPEHGVARHQALARNAPVALGSTALWELVLQRIDESAALGHLAP
jgi:putative hydrolase of HD superfamily